MSIPFRGWYKLDDGRDMEGNGAVPDIEIWPQPAEIPNKIDQQLSKAVEVLLETCRGFNNSTSVDLEPASTQNMKQKHENKRKTKYK
jgi:C-terminal processing protease CtpA/Prc